MEAPFEMVGQIFTVEYFGLFFMLFVADKSWEFLVGLNKLTTR